MAAVSIQFMPSSSARWMAVMDWGVVLRAPAEFPIATDSPGAEADGGDGHVRITKNLCFHNFI